ncbi:ParA family protein [Novosphingobium terrae]|uniref:ParA family protein n=1 Tax=Novosphingobium terrae TaxID=2726189 RepID=UPI001981FEDB|nr:ParA family protein [Novosphingobium terrae]
MKTLVIANQKGGVGKTATFVHLVFDYAARGLKIAAIDLDTQGNASFTLAAHKTGVLSSDLYLKPSIDALIPTDNVALVEADPSLAEIERLPLADGIKALRQKITAMEEAGFDLCLIDTAPSLGVAMASALAVADFVVSPIELEVYSFQGITSLVTTITNIRDNVNPNLNWLGMIPAKYDARNPRHRNNLATLRESYPSLVLNPVGNRSSIAEALETSKPVWAIQRTAARKAAQEVRAVNQQIFDMMVE